VIILHHNYIISQSTADIIRTHGTKLDMLCTER